MRCSELQVADARVEAAASTTGLGPYCPRAALFLVATLLGVKTPADFTPTVRLAFRDTVQQLAGPGMAGNSHAIASAPVAARGRVAGANGGGYAHLPTSSNPLRHKQCFGWPALVCGWVPIKQLGYPVQFDQMGVTQFSQSVCWLDPRPRAAGASVHLQALEGEDGAQAVHAVVSFDKQFVAGGTAAAARLEGLLLRPLGRFFDRQTFGSVHMEVVSAPFLVWVWGARTLGFVSVPTPCLAASHTVFCTRTCSSPNPSRLHASLPQPPPCLPLQADGRGNALLEQLPGTSLAAMVSVAFYDIEPAGINGQVISAYKRAFLKLAPGACGCCAGSRQT